MGLDLLLRVVLLMEAEGGLGKKDARPPVNTLIKK
jgi:hypothetical protein